MEWLNQNQNNNNDVRDDVKDGEEEEECGILSAKTETSLLALSAQSGVVQWRSGYYSSSDNNKKTTSATKYASDATIAVVTIIMLIDGDSTSKALSSNVNSLRDVEDALSRIATDAKADACLRSAEILWTPEERSETLTMKEVLADYSNLRSV